MQTTQNVSQITSMIDQLRTGEENNATTLDSLSQQAQGSNAGLSSQLTSLAKKERQAAQQLQQLSQMISQMEGGRGIGTTSNGGTTRS